MLYKVQKKDISEAGAVLADAFSHDPVWVKLFMDENRLDQKFPAFFEVPIRYCMKYGKVYATSENLEGVAAWVPGRLADMDLWRIILSGAIVPGLRMGQRPMRRMSPSFELLRKNRKEYMNGKPYIYLQIVGIATRFQGRGYGGRLIRAVINEGSREKMPIYLETETEGNVCMYEKFGFRVIKKIILPVFNLPMWEMVRHID